MSEENVSELEGNSVEIIPIKNTEKKDGKQKQTAPLTHGTVSKGLTFKSLIGVPEEEERGIGAENF